MIGEKFSSNRDGDVVVVSYEGSKKISIRWLNTGNTSTVQIGALRKGLMRDASRIAADKQADAERSRAYAEKLAAAAIRRELGRVAAAERKAAIEQKRMADRASREASIAVREAAKAIREAKTLAALDLSTVQLDESTHRKGVLELDFKDREGKWILRFGNSAKGWFVQTRLGKLHNNMSQRAKAGGSVQDVHNTSYKGVGMSELFADPQKFCDWAVQQPGWGLGWQLDKDLLGAGSRVYSEDNCVFLPRRLNHAIAVCKDAAAVRRLATAYQAVLDPRAYSALSTWKPKVVACTQQLAGVS